MTVKELAHMLNRECYLGMIEIIEQVGDSWEIEDIDVSNEGELLTIMYKKREN